ncbi:MAG: hypothetical protein RR262_00215, partial [Clostridium sp.]
MITNKLLALLLSLCTAGGATAGAVGNVANNIEIAKSPNQAIIQKMISNPQNGGQTIDFPLNLKNDFTVIAPTNENCDDATVVEVPVTNPDTTVETPKTEDPKVEVPVVEVPVIDEPKTQDPVIEVPVIEEPKVEVPVKEEPKTEAPKVETPATTPSTSVPSGV